MTYMLAGLINKSKKLSLVVILLRTEVVDGDLFLIQNFQLDISEDVCDKFRKTISLLKRDQVILQLFNSSSFKP